MSTSITLTGGKELADALRGLTDRVATNVLRAGMARGANKFRDEIRSRVPILDMEKGNGPHEPGLLLKSVIARRMRSRNRNEVRAGVLILKEAFYWRFVEFGTRHASAHPFIRPAADVAGGVAAQTVINYARERIAGELKR